MPTRPPALQSPPRPSRPIDDRIDPHIHTWQTPIIAVMILLSLVLIPHIRVARTLCRRAATLTGAICIILSAQIIDADAAVIRVVVRTSAHALQAGARRVEQALAARVRAGCGLQVFEPLG